MIQLFGTSARQKGVEREIAYGIREVKQTYSSMGIPLRTSSTNTLVNTYQQDVVRESELTGLPFVAQEEVSSYVLAVRIVFAIKGSKSVVLDPNICLGVPFSLSMGWLPCHSLRALWHYMSRSECINFHQK